jgi:hypothetical protein
LLLEGREQLGVFEVVELPPRQGQQLETVGHLLVLAQRIGDFLGGKAAKRDAGDGAHVAQFHQHAANAGPANVMEIVDQQQAQAGVVHRAIRLAAKLRGRAAPAGLAAKRLQNCSQQQRDLRPVRGLHECHRDRRALGRWILR